MINYWKVYKSTYCIAIVRTSSNLVTVILTCDNTMTSLEVKYSNIKIERYQRKNTCWNWSDDLIQCWPQWPQLLQ